MRLDRISEVLPPEVAADLDATRDAWDTWEVHYVDPPVLYILAAIGGLPRVQLTTAATRWGATSIEWLEGVDARRYVLCREHWATSDRDVLAVVWE